MSRKWKTRNQNLSKFTFDFNNITWVAVNGVEHLLPSSLKFNRTITSWLTNKLLLFFLEIISFLLSKPPEAKWLRENGELFSIFKVNTTFRILNIIGHPGRLCKTKLIIFQFKFDGSFAQRPLFAKIPKQWPILNSKQHSATPRGSYNALLGVKIYSVEAPLKLGSNKHTPARHTQRREEIISVALKHPVS